MTSRSSEGDAFMWVTCMPSRTGSVQARTPGASPTCTMQLAHCPAQHISPRLRWYLKLRENSRFYHIMGFGIIRKKVLRIEAELMRAGKLRCKDDIFFLQMEEVADLQADRLGWLDVEDRIRERRIDHLRGLGILLDQTGAEHFVTPHDLGKGGRYG